jgi:hypothetical protein
MLGRGALERYLHPRPPILLLSKSELIDIARVKLDLPS